MEPVEKRDDEVSQEPGRAEALAQAVEAMVFAADEPVTWERIVAVFGEITQETQPSRERIEAVIEQLNQKYEEQHSAFRIRHWGGGYRMSTTVEVAPYLKALYRQDRHRRLTRSLMETLAILAYRQPATKPEIDFIRGVDADYALRKLLEIGLIDVVGRGDSVGRPLLYGTTQRFLEEFGLAELMDLPNLREIEELLSDPAFNIERARLLMLRGLDSSEPPETSSGDS
ncbi:MAG: SMC-Scp complex subunit ScpB [Rhodothermales bacterium]